jgi:hypothetical protein
MAKKKPQKKQVDDDMAIWERLGGVETDVDDGRSEWVRILEDGNQWARQQLQPPRPLRPSVLAVNPFRRDQ